MNKQQQTEINEALAARAAEGLAAETGMTIEEARKRVRVSTWNTSMPDMNEAMVSVPRRILQELGDIDYAGYVRILYTVAQFECGYCKQHNECVDEIEHDSDCPILWVQERLKEQP